METRNGKATAGTVAQVKAQEQTKTLDSILAELTPIVKATFPKANGRVERAVELVEAGAVLELRPINHQNGHQVFTVKGNGRWYTVTAQGCTCKDSEYNGGQPCKHMIARWLVIRAQQADGTRPGGNGERARSLPVGPAPRRGMEEVL